MSLKEKIKSDIILAIKEKRNEKSILRVVLGEINTQEARLSKELADEDIHKIIKKIMQGVEEMLQYKSGDNILTEEKMILSRLLPKYLSQEEILAILTAIELQLKGARSSGQAMGVSMKYLKENKHSIEANDVNQVVERIRNG